MKALHGSINHYQKEAHRDMLTKRSHKGHKQRGLKLISGGWGLKLSSPLFSTTTTGFFAFTLYKFILAKMLFFSYFKDLVGREVTVELKNDLAIRGTLHSVDQYLNIKLENTRVVDQDKYPHMLSVRNCFIRGSVVRYVQLPPEGVDIELLHDATRREARSG
ncbi:unnamed protein product [Vicia faba]|nr:unnamed protein product [Vicia faba]